MNDYSSEEDGNSEDQPPNGMFESNRFKGLGSLIPNQNQGKASKSPRSRLAAYMNNKVNSKEKEDKMESDDQSISLGNIHEFLDERSVGSAQSLFSPRKSFHFNSFDPEKKMKETAEQKQFHDKFNEVISNVQTDLKGRNVKFDYIQKVVSLFNDCCNSFLNGTSSLMEVGDEMEEEVQAEPTKTYDFSQNLQEIKPTQSLETKLITSNKLFTSAFDTKVRITNERNQMIALFVRSNPPSRRRMDFNGKNIIAITENDRVFFFESKEFVHIGPPIGKKQPIPSLFKPFGEELGMPPVPFDKSKALSKYTASHPVLSVYFNKSFPNMVALVGLESITFVNLEQNGKVGEPRMLLYHNDADFIIKASWLPGQKVLIKFNLLFNII